MKIEEVPQDDNPTFREYSKKVMYAVDSNGRYRPVASSGWNVEEVVLKEVVDDFESRAQRALRRATRGDASPIEYFMYKKLLDMPSLARGVGMTRWRVRRHMKARIFRRLSPKVLQRYADLFQVDVATLCSPEEKLVRWI